MFPLIGASAGHAPPTGATPLRTNVGAGSAVGRGDGRLVGAIVEAGGDVGRGVFVDIGAVVGSVDCRAVGRPPSAAPTQLRMTSVMKPMAILPRQPAFQRRAMVVVSFCMVHSS